MAFNPMQQQQSPDMLMAMMTDPRATPQQRMAAMSALNTMRGGANAPQPPQMTGDSTGVSQMSPAFMAAVRQEMMGQGPEEQPEIPQRQAAPEAPQESSTAALMSGAADASRVAAMAHGGEVKGYAEGESVLQKTVRNAKSANRGDYSFLDGRFRNRGYPRTDILSERLRGLVPPEMTQKEAIEKFYTEGGGKDNPQLIKDMFSNIPDISPENFIGGLGSAINKSVGYLYEKAEPYARRAIDYSVGSELTHDPDFVAKEIKKKRMGDSVPGEEGYQLKSLRNFKPTFQEFPINADSVPQTLVSAPRVARVQAAVAAAAPPPPVNTPPAAVDPANPAVDKEALDAQRKTESEAYKQRMDKLLGDDQPLSNKDKGLALMRAGAAIMAERSPNALTNIGAGIGAGVEGLNEMRERRAVNNMKQATLLQAQRSEALSNEARNRQLDISEGALDVERGGLKIKQQENDPNSPQGKAKLDKERAQIDYYRAEALRAARPEKVSEADAKFTLLTEKGGLSAQDAAQIISGAEPKEMSESSKRVIALKQADEARKAVQANVVNMSLKPDELTKKENAAYQEAYRRALDLLNTETGVAAPPPAGGGRIKFNDLP